MGPDCGDQVPEDVASIIEDYLQQSRRSSAAETEAAEAEIQPNLDIGGGTEQMNVVYTSHQTSGNTAATRTSPRATSCSSPTAAPSR